MNNINYIKISHQKICFSLSIPSIQYLPVDNGIEVAFVGYSNVGKSTAINTLTRQNKLARTSKIPGCTQVINLFKIDKKRRLIDLPGYGYSLVKKNIQKKWEWDIYKYIEKRLCLKGLVLLMDIRYPLKHFDQKIIKKATNYNIPILILLSKADKISKSMRNIQLNIVTKTITNFNKNLQIEIFSSFQNHGVDKLCHQMNIWYNSQAKNFFL